MLIEGARIQLEEECIQQVLSKLYSTNANSVIFVKKSVQDELVKFGLKEEEAKKRIQQVLEQIQEWDYRAKKSAPGWALSVQRANENINKEREERITPVIPCPTGKSHSIGEYIALRISTSGGVLDFAMEDAFKTQDTTKGQLTFAYSKLHLEYAVTCVSYDVQAMTVSNFLKQISDIETLLKADILKAIKAKKVTNKQKTNNIGVTISTFLRQMDKNKRTVTGNINSEYVTTSEHTSLTYRKKGTCKIECTFTDYKSNVSEKSSPQYDDKAGKDMMTVIYKEHLKK